MELKLYILSVENGSRIRFKSYAEYSFQYTYARLARSFELYTEPKKKLYS